MLGTGVEMSSGKKDCNWITIVTAFLSLLSALGVAYIGYQSRRLEHQVDLLKVRVEEESVAVERESVSLEQRRFEAEQRMRRDEIIREYVPMLLSSEETERRIALAVLFVLYPNDAPDILAKVSEAIGEEQSQEFMAMMEQAESIAERTGDWGIVIGSDTTLEAALDEVRTAQEYGYEAVVYYRGGWFATVVGPFPSQEVAESVNIVIRSEIRDSAFVINFNSWCPSPIQRDGYLECQTQ